MSDERFDRLERLFERVERHLQAIDARLAAIDVEIRRLADGVMVTNHRIDRGLGRLESTLQSFIDTQLALNREITDGRDANRDS